MARSPLFPQSYTHWLSARLPGEVSESLATCDSCAMVAPSGLTRDPGPFKAHLKCCTYFPFVPNFGLGAMLEEHGELARARIRAAAQKGLLLPLGLFASPEQEQLVRKAGKKGFGKREDMLCPFYDKTAMGCSMWKQRPGVCATYFCKSEREEEGLEFWSDVESYLNHFEWTLANATTWRLGFTEDDAENCEAVMLTEEPGPERDWLVRAAWAEWAGREEEFFKLCAQRAREITQEELSELLGDDCLQLEKSLRDRIP